MNKKLKISVLLANIIVGFNISLAQTPKEDLSRGNYLVMQKPFQIEAFAFPIVVIDDVHTANFDLETFYTSNFTSFMASVFPLRWYPEKAGDRTWSLHIENERELEVEELAKLDNLYRIQYEDDNLHPAAPNIVAEAEAWLSAKLADPEYDDIIMSVDLPPYDYTPEQLDDFLDRLEPDLIMFNRYPWTPSGKYHYRQIEYGWYAMLIYNRNLAELGIDRTGTLPIPFGAYTQTFWNNMPTPISKSLRRYNAFLSLAFGAKMLSTFLYNDWIYPTPDLKTTLFDTTYSPTPSFYAQAEINRQISNIGQALVYLHTTGTRLIRATNIEANVQIDGFADGVYEWDYRTRPDTILTNVTVTRPNQANYQDVWVGYFEPMHHTLDGTGTTDESYFMVVNGAWDSDDANHTNQIIRMDFDFGTDDSINSLLRLNRLTGRVEKIPLTNISGNAYYFELELDGGEGDLFKYNNGVPFIGVTERISFDNGAQEEVEIFVFPNPTSDNITVSLSKELLGHSYNVFDFTGKSILSGKLSSLNMLIEMGDLESGIYFINTEGIDNNNLVKIIKQ